MKRTTAKPMPATPAVDAAPASSQSPADAAEAREVAEEATGAVAENASSSAVAPPSADAAAADVSNGRTEDGSPSMEDRIREAAYRRWVERGDAEGNSVTDWLEAEVAVRSAAGKAGG